MAKRLLCVLLSVLMVVAMLPTGVFAEEATDVTYAYSESLLTVSNYWGTTVSGTTVTFGGSGWAEAYVNFGNSVDLSLYDTLTYTVSNVTASSPQLKLYYSDGSNSYPSFTADGTYSVTLASTLSYFTIQDGAGESGATVTLDSVTLSDSTGANADLVCTYSVSDLTFSNNWGTTVSGNTVTFGGQGYAEAYIDFPTSIDLTQYESIICTVSAASGSTFQLKLYGSGATKYSDSFTAAGDITYRIDTSTIGDTLTRIAVMDTAGTADSSVTITSVTFVAAETPIKQFTSNTSGDDGVYYFNYSDYVDSWNEDDTLVITAVLSAPAYFQGIVGANDDGTWSSTAFASSDGSAITCTHTVVAGTDTQGQIQIYWMNGSYVNLTSLSIEVISASTSSGTAEFYTRTLSLGTKIGINYYVDFTDVENPEDYSVKFTLSDGSTQTVTYSEATSGLKSDTEDIVKFTCRLDCWNMGLTITTAELLNGDEVVQTDTNYSIETYAERVYNNGDALDELLNAMLTYGHYATEVHGGEGVSDYSDNTSSVEASDVSDYQSSTVTGTPASYVTAQLILDDTVELKFNVDSAYTVC